MTPPSTSRTMKVVDACIAGFPACRGRRLRARACPGCGPSAAAARRAGAVGDRGPRGSEGTRHPRRDSHDDRKVRQTRDAHRRPCGGNSRSRGENRVERTRHRAAPAAVSGSLVGVDSSPTAGRASSSMNTATAYRPAARHPRCNGISLLSATVTFVPRHLKRPRPPLRLEHPRVGLGHPRVTAGRCRRGL